MNYNILWACGLEVLKTAQGQLVDMLKNDGHIVEIVEKYHTQGFYKEYANGDYNLLIINENLEKNSFDLKILESYKDQKEGLQVILIIGDEHVGDSYAKELVNRELYDVLYTKEASANAVYDLIVHPRQRSEAKHYLKFDDNVLARSTEVKVDKKVIQTIVYHLTETAVENKTVLFRDIFQKFDEEDSFYILDSFPLELLEQLKEEELIVKYYDSKPIKEEILQEERDSSGKLNNIISGIKTLTGKKENDDVEIVEKIVEVPYKEIDSAVICLISAKESGKSFLAWNLGYCFTNRNYSTSLVNIDSMNSANLYYGIPEVYHELLSVMLEAKQHKDILEYCYKRGKLNVITGKLGDSNELEVQDFERLMYFIKAKSDITLIDCRSGFTDLVRASMTMSNMDLLVFNSDLNHFHMNKLLIEQLGDDFVPEKTIAVINNCDVKSDSYKFIYNEIKNMELNFKSILPISTCGTLGCDMMHTSMTAYEAAKDKHRQFKDDIDGLLNSINSREKKKSVFGNMIQSTNYMIQKIKVKK